MPQSSHRSHPLAECWRSGGRRRVAPAVGAALAVVFMAMVLPSSAEPTTGEQASSLVEHWLAHNPAPLGAELVKPTRGDLIKGVETFTNADGDAIYYVVSLDPEGFVVVSTDDLLEPIIAFSSEGSYDPGPGNALHALLSVDMAGRVARLKDAVAAGRRAGFEPTEAMAVHKGNWDALLAEPGRASGIQFVGDVYVDQMVMSNWAQGAEGGRACYNYYTPTIYDDYHTFEPGNPDNIVCGCVATATAQAIRYFEWPKVGVGNVTGGASITFRNEDAVPPGANISMQLRGGNGNGGPYDWDAMTLDPDGSEPEHNLQQIGALCFDSGLAVGMGYNIEHSNMSGSGFKSTAFTNKFGFGGAGRGGSSADSMRANFDARRPVCLTVAMTNPLLPPPGGNHAIVGDGYGTEHGTWYFHCNYGGGWAWYDYDEYVYSGSTEWSGFGYSVGNIYRTGDGMIISGRITDAHGNPVPDVEVTATALSDGDVFVIDRWNDDSALRNKSDERGIWAIDKLPQGDTYTFTVTKPGLTFAGPDQVVVGTSNVWGLNFTATAAPQLALVDWWYDYDNLQGEAAVIVLRFNRPVGDVTFDPTKITINDGDSAGTRVLTADCVPLYSADSDQVIILLSVADMLAVVEDGLPPFDDGWLAAGDDNATLDLDEYFILDAVGDFLADSQGNPASPTVAGAAEAAGLPIVQDGQTPQVRSTELLVGGNVLGGGANPYPSNGDEVQFLVRFTTPGFGDTDVTGVDRDDFRLTITDSFTNLSVAPPFPTEGPKKDTPLPGAVIISVEPADGNNDPIAGNSSNRWIVTVRVGRGDGYIRLDVIDDNSIASDPGAVLLGGPNPHDGDFVYSEFAHHVDNLGPVITDAVLDPSNAYVTITFSEPVGGTDSVDKTADIPLAPFDYYRWLDNGPGGVGLDIGDAVWRDCGRDPDEVFNRDNDTLLWESPSLNGALQDGSGAIGRFRDVEGTFNGFPLGVIARLCYIDQTGDGCTSDDGFFMDADLDSWYRASTDDQWFLGAEPTVDTQGAVVPDNIRYYSADGPYPAVEVNDPNPTGPLEAWFTSFLLGDANGFWLDFRDPDGFYTHGIDEIVFGTLTAADDDDPGDVFLPGSMYRDNDENGVLSSGDLAWVDLNPNDALDGGDNRFDTNGEPIPGALFSNDLRVILKTNGGTVNSVAISKFTDLADVVLTSAAQTVRAHLRFDPPVNAAWDYAGGSPPSQLNVPAGVETIEIVPMPDSVFDELGNAADTQTTTGEMRLYDPTTPRVIAAILADDGNNIRVLFSERVYTNANGISNHNPVSIERNVGNLVVDDFTVSRSWGGNVTINSVSYTLGTNVCTLNLEWTTVDSAAARAAGATLTLHVNDVYGFDKNQVPDPNWILPMTPAYSSADPDSMPPRYFTSQQFEANTTAGAAGTANYPYTYYGYYYRDLDGDGRVDAVDLNFDEPSANHTLQGIVASQFTVWVQRNDPYEYNNPPADEAGHYPTAWSNTSPYNGNAPFTSDWSTVRINSVTSLGDQGSYTTVRISLNQADVPARTSGNRWIMVRYDEPDDHSFDYDPGEGSDDNYNVNTDTGTGGAAENDDDERNGMFWLYDSDGTAVADQGSYYCIGDFRVIVWDHALPVPVAAAMWRTTNYNKSGEANFNSYDCLDVTFSEALTSVGSWGAVPVSSGVHLKDGPYGPEILDLLGDRRTVRIKLSGNGETDRTFSGSGAVDSSPARNSAPSFSGTAIGVRPLDTRYRVAAFESFNMLVVDSTGATIDSGTAAATDLGANEVTLRGFDQGGFTPNLDADWVQSGGTNAGSFALAGQTNRGLNNQRTLFQFAAVFDTARVTPGDALVSGASQMLVRSSNYATNSQIPPSGDVGIFRFRPPQAVTSGPLYAMVKVHPIPTSGGTSRIDERPQTVLGIDMAGNGNDLLDGVSVRVVDTSYGQFDPLVDLLPLADGDTSGVQLWKNYGTAGIVQLSAGGMEWSEWRINDEGHPYREVVLRPLASQDMPTNDTGANDAYEYEIRIRPSADFNLADSFYVEIPDDGLLFRRGRSSDDFASGWDTADQTPGLPLTDHKYEDGNSDERWGMGETIMDYENPLDPQPFYDAGVPYHHMTQSAAFLKVIRNHQRNLYYAKRGFAPNPDTNPAPLGGLKNPAVDLDYNVVYSPGDDVWYDLGGKRGVYDAGVDIPLFGNSDLFVAPLSPHEEGCRSVQFRGAVPASVNNLSAGLQTISADSGPVAVQGIDMHDSGRAFSPRYPFGRDPFGGVVIEAVSKNLRGGEYLDQLVYSAAAKSLAWRKGAAVVFNEDGRAVLVGPAGDFVAVQVVRAALPAADATASVYVSADVGRDVDQPAGIAGVRVHAVGSGNVPGKTGRLLRNGTMLQWQSDKDSVGTRGAAVDVADGGMFVLNGERNLERDYLVVQCAVVGGATSEELYICSADGRDITPLQNIAGVEIMAVSDMVAQGTYQFSWDGVGSLSWGEGAPTNVKGAEYTIVPGSLDGSAFVVVRDTAERESAEPAEDWLFINQTRLLRLNLTVSDQRGFTSTHLKPLTGGPDSGVALFRDANANGIFDGPAVDEPVPLAQVPSWSGTSQYTLTMHPDDLFRAAYLPCSQRSPAVGNDYFIVVNTTWDMSYGDRFTVGTSVYEPTEPHANLSGAPSFASGSTSIIECNSVTNTIYTDQTTVGQTIDARREGISYASSPPIVLFGIDHFLGSAGTINVQSLTFTFHNVNGFDPAIDLAAMDAADPMQRGLLLFSDNGNGVFQYASDTRVSCIITPDVAGTTFTLSPQTGVTVPASSDGGLSDLFVAILPSSALNYNDSFYVTMEIDGVQYTSGSGNANIPLETNTLTGTIPTMYEDLTTHVQSAGTEAVVVNSIGSTAVTSNLYQLDVVFSPSENLYYLSWSGGGNPVELDMTAVGTYTLGVGTNSIRVTFDPMAFFREDTLLDGDGSTTPLSGHPDMAVGTLLVGAESVSVDVGVDPGGDGGLYYFDADGNGRFGVGDDIVLKPGVPADLNFDVGNNDVVLFHGGDGQDVADGNPLNRFMLADHAAFERSATDPDAYNDGEDIVCDSDGVYSLPWMDQLIDADGTVTTGPGGASLVSVGSPLVGAETVSVAAGTDPGGAGGLYYYDADGSGTYTPVDDIILKPGVGLAGSTLAYDGPTNAARNNGDTNDNDNDGVVDDDRVLHDGGDGIQVAEGSVLRQFVAADYVAFERAGAMASYNDREDIFRTVDDTFQPASYVWRFRSTARNDRRIRKYDPNAPVPFNGPEDAMSAILGIDVANSGVPEVTLDALTVRFRDLTNFNANTDLRALTDCQGADALDSGVLLYKDADANGLFDPAADTLVPLAAAPSWTGLGTGGDPYRLTLTPIDAHTVENPAIDGKYDFFVVVQPSRTVNDSQLTDSGDQFSATISAGDITFNKSVNSQTAQTGTVTVDTQPPTATADISDTDADGYLNQLALTFHETLRTGMEDAADWVLTDADGVSDLSPAQDASVVLDADGVTLRLRLEDIAGTTGAIAYKLAYDADRKGVFDLAGNPADFRVAQDSADSVAPIVLHSGIIVDGWDAATVDETPGIQTGIFFHDRNDNGIWDLGEDIWYDVNGNAGQYDEGVDLRIWNGGNAWSTPDGYAVRVLQTGLYYHDSDGSGTYNVNEDLWLDQDDGFLGVAGQYDVGVDIPLLPRRPEELEVRDTSGNGRIDAFRVTFSEDVDDASLPGYFDHWQTIDADGWAVSGGYQNLMIDPNGPDDDPAEQNDRVLYLVFDEGPFSDTDARPELTTAAVLLTDLAGNVLNDGINYDFGDLVEDDQAPPVLVDATVDAGIDGTGNIAADTTLTLILSEPVTAGDMANITPADFVTDPENDGNPVPGFDTAQPGDVTLSVNVSGQIEVYFIVGTTGGGWVEDAKANVNLATPPVLTVDDLEDGVGHEPIAAVPDVTIRGLGSILIDSVETADLDANGYIDHVRVVFDRPVDDSSLDGYVGPTTLIDVLGAGGHWDVVGRQNLFIDPGLDTADDEVLYFAFDEAVGPTDTDAILDLRVTNAILLSMSGEPIADQLVSGAPRTVDTAAPVMLGAVTGDNDSDGRIDRLTITFSETVTVVDGNVNDGLRGFAVPGYAIANANYADAVGSTTLVLFLVEGGAFDTDVLPVVIYNAAVADSVFDVATVPNELVSGVSVAGTSDGAGPVITDLETGDLNGDGWIDAVHVTFTEDIEDWSVDVDDFDIDGATGLDFRWFTYGDMPGDGDIYITFDDGVLGTGETPDVTYTQGGLTDTEGNLLADSGPTPPVDEAAPVMLRAVTGEAGGGAFDLVPGQIDQITIDFSEPVDVTDGRFSDGLLGFTVTGYVIANDNYAASNVTSVTVNLVESGAFDADATPAVTYNNVSADTVFDRVVNAHELAGGNPVEGTSDGVAPVIVARETADSDADGSVEAVRIVMSEAIDDGTVVLAEFEIDGVAPTGFDTGAVDDDEEFFLTFNPIVGTDATPDVEYGKAATTLEDLAGNLLASDGAAVAADDRAPPLMLQAQTADIDKNGYIDRITVTFSEDVVILDANDVLAGLPGISVAGYAIGGVASYTAVGVNTLVLTLVEGAAHDTGATPAVDYNAGTVDAVFDGVVPPNELVGGVAVGGTFDLAEPITVARETADLNANGFIDAIHFVFSEPVDDASVAASVGAAAFVVDGVAPLAFAALANGDTADDEDIYITFADDALDTAATPDVTYTQGSVADRAAAGNLLPSDAGPVSPADQAIPRILRAETGDADLNGEIDQVTLTFSEPVEITDGDGGDGVPGFALVGYPILPADYEDLAGTTTLTFGLTESGTYDTDALPAVTYNAIVGNNVFDKADEAVTPVPAHELAGGAPVNGTVDKAAPIVVARGTADLNGNGFIDAIHVVFSEPVDDATVVADDFVVAGVGASAFSSTTAGDVAGDNDLYITFGDDALDTGATPLVTYTQDLPGGDADVTDRAPAANLLPSDDAAGVAPADEAAPVMLRAETGDVDANGQIDRIRIGISETVDIIDGSATDGLPGFTVAGYTIANADYADATGVAAITLVLVESGRYDTDAVPAVTYDATAGDSVLDRADQNVPAAGPHELAGGAPFAGTFDKARPIMTLATTDDVDKDGEIDQLTIRFNEPVNIADADADDGLPGFTVTGYQIDDSAYGAGNVTQVTLLLVQSQAFDTGETPVVTYDDGAADTVFDVAVEVNELVGAVPLQGTADGAAPGGGVRVQLIGVVVPPGGQHWARPRAQLVVAGAAGEDITVTAAVLRDGATDQAIPGAQALVTVTGGRVLAGTVDLPPNMAADQVYLHLSVADAALNPSNSDSHPLMESNVVRIDGNRPVSRDVLDVLSGVPGVDADLTPDPTKLLAEWKTEGTAGGNDSGVAKSLYRVMDVTLFDPASEWKLTKPLPGNQGRTDFAAIALNDGTAMILGGWSGGAVLASTAIFDPRTEVWTSSPSLKKKRHSFQAVTLRNGQILALGGYGDGTYLSSIERYVPGVGWSVLTEKLDVARSHFAAILVPGVPAGVNPDRIVVIGGRNAAGYLADLEVLEVNPVNGDVSHAADPAGDLLTARANFVAVGISNERVLVAGGRNANGYLRSAEVLSWSSPLAASATGNLATARAHFDAVLLDSGEVLAVGGWNAGGAVGTGEIYNPDTGVWNQNQMSTPRGYGAALRRTDGLVMAVGGYGTDALRSVDIYDPVSGEWSLSSKVLRGKRYAEKVLSLTDNGRTLLLVGGHGDRIFETAVEILIGDQPDPVWPAAPQRWGETLVPGGLPTVVETAWTKTILMNPPLKDGHTYKVEVMAVDAVGNTGARAQSDGILVDVPGPIPDIGDVAPDPRNTAAGVVTVTFSEDVTGVDIADFSLTRNGAAVGIGTVPFAGAGALYTLDLTSVSATAGTYVLTLKAAGSGIANLSGSLLSDNASDTWVVDTGVPTADIVDVTPDPRNTNAGVVTINFSENVTGVGIDDFSLTLDGGLVDINAVPLLGADDQYTLDLSGVTAAPGAYVLTLVAQGSGIIDGTGNALAADAVDAWATDTAGPTADIVDVVPDPRNTAVGTVTVTFSKNVTGVDISDFSLTRLPATNVDIGAVPFGGSGAQYTLNLSSVTATPGAYVLKLTAAGSGIIDAVGNALAGDATDDWITDTVGPTANIVDVAPDPRNAPAGVVTVDFSKDVTGVDIADFSLTRDGAWVGIGGLLVTRVSAQQYTIDLDAVTGVGGTYVLTLTAAGSGITDTAGNALVGNASDAWSTDMVSPSVTVATVATSPTDVEPIPFTITFSEVVLGFDEGDVVPTNGTIDAGSFQAPTPGRVYSLNVTPLAEGDVTVTVPAGKANDAAGNPNTTGAATVTFYNAVLGVVVTPGEASPTNADPIPFTIAFSAAVTGFELADIQVSNGGTAENLLGTGADYTVDIRAAADGDVTVTVPADAAEEDGVPGKGNIEGSATIAYDGTAPGLPTLDLAAPATGVPTLDTSVDLTWTAAQDPAPGSGVAMYYWLVTNSDTATEGDVLAGSSGAALPAQIDIGPGDDRYWLHALVEDVAGNVSGVLTSGPWHFYSEPLARVSLVFPVPARAMSVSVGETFTVEVWVEENSVEASGFRGGPIDIRFDPAYIRYSGAFNSATAVQAPFNSVKTSGTLNNNTGLIDELGGVTTDSGLGENGPVLYAELRFVAVLAGSPTITVEPGDAGLALTPPLGILPIDVVDYGQALDVSAETTVSLQVVSGVSKVPEAGGSFKLRAVLQHPSDEDVTVDLAFAGTATKDVDYTVSHEALTIAAGNMQAESSVTALQDSSFEATETVVTSIDTVTSASGRVSENGDQQVSVNIEDDDALPGDVSGDDGVVDSNDLLIFVACFGTSAGDPGYSAGCDLDGDGDVDFNDLVIFVGLYGTDYRGRGGAVAQAEPAVPSRSRTTKAWLTLEGPTAPVEVGETFTVNAFVEVDDARGLAGAKFDLHFSTGLADYAGEFDTNDIIQPPFDSIFTNGELDEEAGLIDELGGATTSNGQAYGAAVLYAVLEFTATDAGDAEFVASAGEIGWTIRLAGTEPLPFSEIDFGDPLVVDIVDLNHAPEAHYDVVEVGKDEALSFHIFGDDPDEDAIDFELPSVGQDGYPLHGDVVVVSEDGEAGTAIVTYTPDVGFTGVDEFTFVVSDDEFTSDPAVVELLVGGFNATIQVLRDTAPYIDLCFGMRPGADLDFRVDDGDDIGPFAGPDGDRAALILDSFPEPLQADYRPLGERDVWQVELSVPTGKGEVWRMVWDSADLPDYATLIPAGAGWEANGEPSIDMKVEQELVIESSRRGTETYRYLLIVEQKTSFTYTFEGGWNLIGMPLVPDAASDHGLRKHLKVLSVFGWNPEGRYVDSKELALQAKHGYWVFAREAFEYEISGRPAAGPAVPVGPGWSLVAPIEDLPSPVHAPTIISCWGWLPTDGYFRPSTEDDGACKPGLGYWVYGVAEGLIWGE